MDVDLLKVKDKSTVSQLLEVYDLTGRLTTDENKVLFAELALFPQLQYKLHLLVCLLQHHILYKSIQLPPSYATPKRAGVILPQRVTFKEAYQVPFMSLLPSNTKKMVFQVLHRTIWTENKAFKSGIAVDPRWLRCEEAETIKHLLYGCENFSAKMWVLAGCTMTMAISRYTCTVDYIPTLFSHHLRLFLTSLHSPPYQRCYHTESIDSTFLRNATLSSAMHIFDH